MTETSPNLEVVSEGHDGEGGGSDGGQDLERRRVPRLMVTGEQFRLGANGKIFSVIDLSLDGMALRLLDREDLHVYPVGTRVQGTLCFRRQKRPVRARVRNIRGEVVGFQFEELDAEVLEALRSYLDPVELGRELRPIPSSEGALWYHGPSGTDLLLWRAVDGEFRRMTIFVQGNYVHWDSETGLATGRANPSDQLAEVRGVVRFETMFLEADPRADQAKLNVAKTLVLSSNLPQDLRKWCVRKIEGIHGS